MDATQTIPQLNQLNIGYWTEVARSWGFVAIGSFIGGYYGLGVAYELGLMSRLMIATEKIAIPIIKRFGGYPAIGALMPHVHFYTAWGVRLCFGLLAGTVCKLIQIIVIWIWNCCTKRVPSLNRIKMQLSI